MSDYTRGNIPPFQTLGSHLRYLREQLKESVAEVSGAVEIDESTLQRIEQGIERPSEDILMLLITHYDTHDHEAVQLWELAGYDHDDAPVSNGRLQLDDLAGQQKQLVMLLAMDLRVMYSDGLDIDLSDGGLTLNFTQAGSKGKRQPVGRIGMSYEQAGQVMRTLEQALLKARYLRGPQGLPAPKDKPKD